MTAAEKPMPITCPVTLRGLDREEFVKIDYRVMRCAFDSQNQMGRLCDEVIYKNDLAARLETVGRVRVRREVPVKVAYRTTLLELVADWGGFLELSLYTEAVVHVLGGEQVVLQRIGLKRDGVMLGSQRFHLLNPDTAFRLTALPDCSEEYEPQLQALLQHSPLSTLQWVNFARHRIQFVTLTKS